MSAESRNLEAISRAIDQHNSSCPYPAAEVRMNPFEVERLGWDEIRGLPVVPDSSIGTGRFEIVCSRDTGTEDLDVAEEEVSKASLHQTEFQKSRPSPPIQRCSSMLIR